VRTQVAKKLVTEIHSRGRGDTAQSRPIGKENRAPILVITGGIWNEK
jgi:hypothetical protein